jgi:hypothetical protein
MRAFGLGNAALVMFLALACNTGRWCDSQENHECSEPEEMCNLEEHECQTIGSQGEGATCSFNDSLCAQGLVCNGGSEPTRCVRTYSIAEDAPCGGLDVCRVGLVCRSTDWHCHPPATAGDECIDPIECLLGLTCHYYGWPMTFSWPGRCGMPTGRSLPCLFSSECADGLVCSELPVEACPLQDNACPAGCIGPLQQCRYDMTCHTRDEAGGFISRT